MAIWGGHICLNKRFCVCQVGLARWARLAWLKEGSRLKNGGGYLLLLVSIFCQSRPSFLLNYNLIYFDLFLIIKLCSSSSSFD